MNNVVLEAKGLNKRYGNLTAVQDLSMQVLEGGVFGFLGPNGAGKTTSIHMLCGLLSPDAGEVLVRGKRIANGDPAVRARVGMCPQKIVVWERLTCLEQLVFIGEMYGLSPSLARQRSEQLLKDVDLTERRNQLAKTLSGGMQRRLNLALALVHDPEIVVLDEPEAGLDPQTRIQVREFIRSLARRKTVVLTTHDMEEADRVSDRVAIIDHGRLLVLDTPERLKRQVGEGDTVEIRLVEARADGQVLAESFAALNVEAGLEDGGQIVKIRALNAVGRLPELLGKLESLGVPVGEVSIRPNSLEDVFIQLTGRRLRE
ncbi:MAG: ABC transporter ATP-binding protein [Anaerolineaceae bacterium]|nr:ABC transporter ATP-binding protein [Anaerolineaceae bacterium]